MAQQQTQATPIFRTVSGPNLSNIQQTISGIIAQAQANFKDAANATPINAGPVFAMGNGNHPAFTAWLSQFFTNFPNLQALSHTFPALHIPPFGSGGQAVQGKNH